MYAIRSYYAKIVAASQKLIIDVNHFCEYMPPGFNGSSKDIGAYKVAIKREQVGSNVYVTGVIVGSKAAGGELQSMDRKRSSRIASLIGSHGGYINAGDANGAQGTWKLAVTDYFGASYNFV